MRIYDGDFTVGRLIEACSKPSARRVSGLPVQGHEEMPEIDITKLNAQLAKLPIQEIRRRRQRMNTFYEEVLVSSDADRGIQFTTLLLILAHHKVINDNKSLRYVFNGLFHCCCMLTELVQIRGIPAPTSSPHARRGGSAA